MGRGRRLGGDLRARGAGRAGVSAHLLMAGIWGVIERGGRPGARVGLHEQLNVIRPGPSGSSWVIDNPAAFLPARDIKRAAGGGRGGGAAHGDLGPFSAPRCPRLRGGTQRPALFLLWGLSLAHLPGAAEGGVEPQGAAPRE